MRPTAIAIACHPDDIEFMMAGTLLRLKEAGYEIHYMNIADGSLGSATMDPGETAAVRRREAMEAATRMGRSITKVSAATLKFFTIAIC